MSPRQALRLLLELAAALTLVLVAAAARADAVTEWNEMMQGTVERVDPFMQIRTSVITHLAIFDAVNSIVGDYEPYLAKIDAPQRASAEAAAIAAAHRALSVLHPDQRVPLDARLEQDLARIADGPTKQAGVKLGIAAADAILAKRADDGSDIEVPYEPGTKPGQYRPTPPDFSPAFRPGMGRVVPFTSCSTSQFRPEPPPALDSAHYARDLAEVRKGGDVNSPTRTRYQTDIARFYEVTDAVQLWYPAARQVSRAQRKTLSHCSPGTGPAGCPWCPGAGQPAETRGSAVHGRRQIAAAGGLPPVALRDFRSRHELRPCRAGCRSHGTGDVRQRVRSTGGLRRVPA